MKSSISSSMTQRTEQASLGLFKGWRSYSGSYVLTELAGVQYSYDAWHSYFFSIICNPANDGKGVPTPEYQPFRLFRLPQLHHYTWSDGQVVTARCGSKNFAVGRKKDAYLPAALAASRRNS